MNADVRQKEISRDLDDYISSKRKGGGLFGLFSKGEQMTVTTHPHVKTYEETPAVQESVAESVVAQDAAGEATQESTEQKKGWFSRWFSDENAEQPAQEAPLETAPAADDDLKEIARISLSFLKMADPAALAQIKASPDFDKFKEILRRRNIIK